MTTKTDTQSVMELKDKYKPKTRGILSPDEIDLIRDTLELKTRTNIELQNIRDVTVMLYGQFASASTNSFNGPKSMEYMDAMSGICGVIDQEKVRRGMEV